MIPLGTVETLTYGGNILVRARFAPREGSVVCDRLGKRLGFVKRVFGPVKEPFVTVAARERAGLSCIGAEVFVDERVPERRAGHRPSNGRNLRKGGGEDRWSKRRKRPTR
ncbi:MAG: hypothetical protein HZB92_04260 [Euryarchaeota archaeon]|nr:hypothetical protein [Euryarchaeota archaeon]